MKCPKHVNPQKLNSRLAASRNYVFCRAFSFAPLHSLKDFPPEKSNGRSRKRRSPLGEEIGGGIRAREREFRNGEAGRKDEQMGDSKA